MYVCMYDGNGKCDFNAVLIVKLAKENKSIKHI